MTRKLGSWLIVLVMLAMACGDSGDESGDATLPPVTDEQAQPGTTVPPDQPPVTESPDDATAATDALQDLPEPTTTTRGSAEDLVESDATVAPVAGSAEPDPGTTEPDPGEPLTEIPAGKVPRALEPFVASAMSDLAARLGVDAFEIGVAVAETMVWPDGAVGCPDPDMAYTQVQVEGVRAVLTNGGGAYAYHGGGTRPGPFLCESPG